MPEDFMAGSACLSASEFLAALERSGVLPDAKCVRCTTDSFRGGVRGFIGPGPAAHRDGTLTEFQARRLLRGKKGLNFGRYALLDHLGQGSRGRVFKARHRLMDRVVALKVLLRDGALKRTGFPVLPRNEDRRAPRPPQRGPGHRCRRAREPSLHRHGVPRRGRPGSRAVRRGPLPPAEVIKYMAQASRGLAHAHEEE